MSSPGSAKLTTFSLLGGVPWVISAKDAFTTLATDWSVVDCVSWLGAAGRCAFIASATASCTALEIEAERAYILTAMRGCSVEASACCCVLRPGRVSIRSVTRTRFAELRVRV